MKFSRTLLLALVTVALAAATPPHASAQKKPKPALKRGDAQRAIASTPGFSLNRSTVRISTISPAGSTPVVVTAEVEVALGFTRIEGEGGGPPRWRAVEFRTGDRNWEDFDYLAGPLSAEAVGRARVALEEMAREFEGRQRELKKSEEKEGGMKPGEKEEVSEQTKGEDAQAGRGKVAEAEAGKKIEVRRGPLLMKEFAPIYKSARAVVTVEAAFTLERDAAKKWHVASFNVGDAAVSNFDELIASVNGMKAERARADLDAVRRALEEFRREHGFYVVADSEVVLIDHLSPRYLKTVIRIDPWHRPYRYNGTRDNYTLSSDGPDGLPSTNDDVTFGGR